MNDKVAKPSRANNNENRSLIRESIPLENKAPLALAPPKCPQKKKEPNRALAAKKIDNNKPCLVPKMTTENP